MEHAEGELGRQKGLACGLEEETQWGREDSLGGRRARALQQFMVQDIRYVIEVDHIDRGMGGKRRVQAAGKPPPSKARKEEGGCGLVAWVCVVVRDVKWKIPLLFQKRALVGLQHRCKGKSIILCGAQTKAGDAGHLDWINFSTPNKITV